MFRKTNSLLSIGINTPKQTPNFFIKTTIFTFSENPKKYTPMVPLSDPKYNLIFLHEKFTSRSMIKSRSLFLYWLPAGLIALNSYLTEWNTPSSIAFAVLLYIGASFRFRVKNRLFHETLSLQISSDLRNFYFVTPKTSKGKLYHLKGYFKIKDEMSEKESFDYYRLIDDSQFMKETTYDKICEIKRQVENDSKEPFSQALAKQDLAWRTIWLDMQNFEAKVLRFHIEKDQIKRIYFNIQDKEQLRALEADKERLSVPELMKKYENHEIIIELMMEELKEKNKNVFFRVKMAENRNKKTHDFLIAMALGYQIQPITGTSKLKGQ